MANQSDNELEPGRELAGYRVEALIGRGGMGVVYRAFDLALERNVALKLLAPPFAQDTGFRDRFHRESRLAASLDHPSVVPIYEAGEVDGQLYIAMRLVEGTDLKQLLQEEGKLEPARALAIVAEIGEALDAAHERGLVHRDVKPANVLLDSRGHCYLADFGLSRLFSDQQSQSDGRSLGTSDYIAPEQIRGEQTSPETDVYSLGCLLYECLTRDPPFRRPTELATIFAHLEEQPPPLPRLERVLAKALAKDPQERYPSCGELAEEASSCLGLSHRRRRRVLAAASIATVVILVTVAAASVVTQLANDDGAIRKADALAEQAVAAANQDPVAALSVAVEAARAAHTPMSEGALRVALASDRLQATLRGHAGYVNSAAFSRDGRRLVTASDDQTARIWDAQSGRSLRVLRGHTGSVGNAAFSTDGRKVLTVGGSDGTIRIWDVASGRNLHVLRERRGLVYSANYSPGGDRILAVSDVGARIWDVETGRNLRVFRGSFGSAVFSSDGKRVLTASYDAARMWDASTGRSLGVLRPEGGGVGGAAFSPDGQRAVTFGGRARLWDIASGRILHALGESELVWNATFSSDARLVLTVESPESSPSSGGTARIWDVATGQQRRFLPRVTNAAFSLSGAEVLSADPEGDARIWDVLSAVTLRTFRSRPSRAATFDRDGLGSNAVFSPTDAEVVTFGGSDNAARIWDAGASSSARVLPGTRVVALDDDGVAWIRDAASGRILQRLEGNVDGVAAFVFSQDGRRVVASDDESARIWATATGRLLHTLRGHAEKVSSSIFGAGGELVATASDDGTARIWDSSSGQPLRVLRGHSAAVSGVDFSSDGKRALTISTDRTARIWNVDTGDSEQLLTGHTRAVVSGVFSDDVSLVLTSSTDGTARIWDASTGRMLKLLRVGPVLGAVFSRDGKEVLTVGRDRPSRVWDAATATSLQMLRSERGLDGAGFSLDGRQIVATRRGRLWRIWACDVCGIPFRELLARAKVRLSEGS